MDSEVVESKTEVPDEVVLLVDFSDWEEDGYIVLALEEVHDLIRLRVGMSVLAEDNHGNTCQVFVEKIRYGEAQLRPEWGTWHSAPSS